MTRKKKNRNKIDGLIELIRSDGSIVINKKLAWAIGINAAILYSELISRYAYFDKKGELDKEGYFYNTIEDLRAGTCLTRYKQDLAIRRLVKLKLLAVRTGGFKNKRYFKIKCGKVAYNTLRLLLLKDYLVCKKLTHSKEKEPKKASVCKKLTNPVCKKFTNSSNNTNPNNTKKRRGKEFFTKNEDKEKKEKEEKLGNRSVDEQIEILRKRGYKF